MYAIFYKMSACAHYCIIQKFQASSTGHYIASLSSALICFCLRKSACRTNEEQLLTKSSTAHILIKQRREHSFFAAVTCGGGLAVGNDNRVRAVWMGCQLKRTKWTLFRYMSFLFHLSQFSQQGQHLAGQKGFSYYAPVATSSIVYVR